jgi:hypothetical protein
MTWQDTQNSEYLNLIESRLETVNLVWVKQFLAIIAEERNTKSLTSLKDVGCQALQFYKQLRLTDFGIKYFGYDLERLYLNIGILRYPEVAENLFHEDFAHLKSPIFTDISVSSATLEHVDDWMSMLDNLIQSTTHLILIRTFLNVTTNRHLVHSANAKNPYPIWEFGFEEITTFFAHRGWQTKIVRDEYTDSLPFAKWYEHSQTSVLRTFFILAATPRPFGS